MEQDNNKPTPQKNRKFINIAIAIIVLVVIGALVSNGKWKKRPDIDSSGLSTQTELLEGCKPGYLFSETTGKPCPAETNITETASSSFDQAIRAYAGKTILLDASCSAYPATATFTPNTRVLVVNNSAATFVVALADKKEELSGYHYFTTSLKAAGEYKVSCNGVDKAVITIK